MRLSGVNPNSITYLTLIVACSDSPFKVLSIYASIHALVCKLGLDKTDVIIGTALVRMYAKLGRVNLARLVFDHMDFRNLNSWNTMLDGYMRNGNDKCAIKLFDEMPERDAISWTAMINGFVKKGRFEEALELFRDMQRSDVEPDYVTIIAVLTACASVGSLGLGLWLHRFVLKHDYRDNVKLNNALIDVYSRCGCVELARQVFKSMKQRTLVSWNSIIVGLATNGYAEETLEYFESMLSQGFKPDGISFTGALTACSHAGLVNDGLKYFDIMKRVYRISPRIEHYGCLVDLYSRAGRLEEALNVVETMSVKPNEVVMSSLLAACRTNGNVNLAEKLMKYIVDCDPDDDSSYVLLANMYAANGRWDGAGKIRRKMKGLGIQKKPGISSIEIGCCSHEFVAGDKSHVHTDNIYSMLELLYSDMSYQYDNYNC